MISDIQYNTNENDVYEIVKEKPFIPLEVMIREICKNNKLEFPDLNVSVYIVGLLKGLEQQGAIAHINNHYYTLSLMSHWVKYLGVCGKIRAINVK